MRRLRFVWLVLGVFLAACTSGGVTSTVVEPEAPGSSTTMAGATTKTTPAVTTSTAPATIVVASPGWDVITPQLEEPPFPEGVDPSEISYPPPMLSRIVFVGGTIVGLGEANDTFAVWRTDDLAQWTLVHNETFTPTCPEEVVDFIMTAEVVDEGLYVFASAQRPCGDPQGFRDIPVVFTSDDLGRSWDRASLPDRGAFVSDLAVTGDLLHAVGWFYPTADSRPQPAIWNSPDGGRTWNRVSGSQELFPSDAMISRVTELDDRLIAVGEYDFEVSVWLSIDGGASWTRTVLPDSGQPESVDTLDDALVLVTNRWDDASATRTFLSGTSTDGVEIDWNDLGPAFGDSVQSLDMVAWRDSLVALATILERSDPQYCFQDLETCQQKSTVVNIGAPGAWRQLDAANNTDLPNRFVQMDVIDSRIIALTDWDGSTEQQRLWIWDLATDSTTVEISAPTTTVPPLPIHDPTQPLELGVTERFVFTYSGCGANYLSIGGQNWIRTEVTEPEDSWPLRDILMAGGPGQYLYATITLVDENHIEARLETGELVAVYEPTTESAPGCF